MSQSFLRCTDRPCIHCICTLHDAFCCPEKNEDDKTICELFFCLVDELDDITFSYSMHIIIDALMDTVMEYFHITEQQLEEFTASFVQRLPKYMQEALLYGQKVA